MQIVPYYGKTKYIELGKAICPVYYLNEKEIVMLDSGTGVMEELPAWLQGQGLQVRAVLCSHLHPDHIANNELLYRNFGSEIFVSEEDLCYLLENGNPFSAEEIKLWAENRWTPGFERRDLPYPVTVLPSRDQTVDIDGTEMQILYTPGHSPCHYCLVTPDDVCYVGDLILSADILKRSKLPYFWKYDMGMHSIYRMRDARYSRYLIAHKGMATKEEWEELVDQNIGKELTLYQQLKDLISDGMEVEQLLERYEEVLNISPAARKRPYFHAAVLDRIQALEYVGEVRISEGRVYRISGLSGKGTPKPEDSCS
jgi:hydroxyacylglutathione hydrolase